MNIQYGYAYLDSIVGLSLPLSMKGLASATGLYGTTKRRSKGYYRAAYTIIEKNDFKVPHVSEKRPCSSVINFND